MAEQATHEDFRPHLSKTFRVRGGQHALVLRHVEEFSGGLASGQNRRSSFALIFSGPAGDVLREGIYAFEVDGGLSFEFHIMPIHTPVPDHQEYQAIFN